MAARSILLGVLALGCSDPDTYTDPAPSRGPVPEETSTDYALSFDGVDDYVTTATSAFPFAEASQSVASWVKVSSSDGQRAIVTMRRGEESGILFGIEDGQLVAYNVWGMRAFVTTSEPLTADEWHHVAYTQQIVDEDDSDPMFTQRLYVDGVLSATGDLAPQNRTPIVGYIGAFNSQRSLFSGELDELRIWARQLSEEEIVALAAGTGEPSPEGLVAEWSFNDAPGSSTAYDRSPLKNHATLGDGASEFMPRRVVSDR